MARRAGKAATRRARQRTVRRPTPPAAPSTAATPAGSLDAPEPTATPEPRQVAAPVIAAGSSLSARERADYHYVERDLRNIGILSAVMVVLLIVAWVAFSALGLIG